MKGLLIFLALFILKLSFVLGFECPSSASLGECKCYDNVQTIQCYNVSEVKLDIHTPFKSLIINLSRMKNITAADLGSNVTFETITINSNPNLEYIEPKIFHNSSMLKSLMINHNPRIGSRILEIVKYLTVTESITFVDNNITTIPDYAFKTDSGQDSKLKFIYLYNNSITTVGAYAFDGLPRVEEIRLDHNFIKTLDAHSFYINTEPITRYVDINLSHNLLNLTNPIIVNNIWTTDLYVEYNGLKTLPEVVFKAFFENFHNKLHANGNPFVCECATMKWILSDIFKSNLIHVKCSNFNDMEITSMTSVDELCHAN